MSDAAAAELDALREQIRRSGMDALPKALTEGVSGGSLSDVVVMAVRAARIAISARVARRKAPP